MKQKGLFFVIQDESRDSKQRMVMSKICGRSQIDKWSNYDTKYPLYQIWNSMLTNFKSQDSTPMGIKSVVMSANEMWAWMFSERAFMTNAQ